MAKKSKVEKSNANEMVHFRPGSELGTLISQFAEQSAISRGEVAKRLTGLAIRGLDVSIYGEVEELALYLYGNANFDEASHALHVAIHMEASQLGVDVVDLEPEKKVEIARLLLLRYQEMRGFEEETQKKRVQIKLYRTTE